MGYALFQTIVIDLILRKGQTNSKLAGSMTDKMIGIMMNFKAQSASTTLGLMAIQLFMLDIPTETIATLVLDER